MIKAILCSCCCLELPDTRLGVKAPTSASHIPAVSHPEEPTAWKRFRHAGEETLWRKNSKGFYQGRPSDGAALLAHADDACCWTWNTHGYPPDTRNMVWLSGPERSPLTSSHSSHPALGFGCTHRTTIWSLHSFYRRSILMQKLKWRNNVAAQLAKVIKSNSSPVNDYSKWLQMQTFILKSCKSSSVITSKTIIPSLIFWGESGKTELKT